MERPTQDCDVLVIGSGTAGYCAAIQAARCGCDTILLEKDAVLGGNSGPDLGVGITGAERWNAYAAELGILQQIREDACHADALPHLTGAAMGYSISRRFEAVVQEHLQAAGVRVFKRHYARKPVMAGSRIAAVIAEDMAAFRAVEIRVGTCVIEASGDGAIAALAGADFDMGSEAQGEFGERSAPPQRSGRVQGTSLVAIAHRTAKAVRFIAPKGTPQFVPRVWHGSLRSFLHHHAGWLSPDKDLMFLYVTETGGHLDTIADDGLIYEMLLGQLWAEWDHIKNGPHCEEAACWDLLWVSPKAGKRESRRLMGDYVLTQTDCEAGRRFEDDIAYGGHDLDDHRPLGEGGDIFAYSVPPMYGIPYRCCYSRNVDNLLLAGRLMSATHIAHSSSRIMGTGAAVGQAVGLAAALCRRHGCGPRGVGQRHIGQLQRELLVEDGSILGRPLREESDLAQRAAVEASGELRFNAQEPGRLVPLIAPAGVLLWDWPRNLQRAEFYLANHSRREQRVTLTASRARREPRYRMLEDYRAEGGWDDLRDEAFVSVGRWEATVPAGFEGWFAIRMPGLELEDKDVAGDADRLLLWLSESPGLKWAMAEEACEIAEAVEHSHQRPRWAPLDCMGCVRLTPAPPLGEATNVLNGFSRRFGRGPTNLWMSVPSDGLPQELTLCWDTEQTLRRVCILFDTLCREDEDNPWRSGAPAAPMCVRDYDLVVREGHHRQQVVQVRGNVHRRREHELEPVGTRELRLRVLATQEEGWGARVYSIRAYGADG